MRYSKVTSKGQVTIPKSIRKRMGIDERTKLIFVDDGDRILAFKVDPSLEKLYGSVSHTGEPLDFRKLREATKKGLARKTAQATVEPGTARSSASKEASD